MHSVEAKKMISLPRVVATNTGEQYNLRMRDSGTLLFLVRLKVYKEQRQMDYYDGSIRFTETNYNNLTEDETRIAEPTHDQAARL